MITVIVTVSCQPGHKDDFLREFNAIVPEVRNEDGCIEYGPMVDTATDLENQHTDAHRVTIVEKWESLPALKAHLVAPHMETYRPKVREYIGSSELRILEGA
jgi:quinol monooxygenase YgiN